jgi:cation diffusion facilitator family transporter
MQSGGKKAVIAALLANLGIAISKFVGFAFTGAASMLAEAIHSVVDSSNQGLLLFGASRSTRAPTAKHPFGYGTERYFWSFVVALVLFTLGGVFALYEGIEKLTHPHPIESVWWAIGILAVAVVLEAFSFRTAIKESREIKGAMSWAQFIRHSKVPELPVVLLEDLGALLGLVIALAGVSLAAITGDARFDAAGSIAIGALLCLIAAILAVEMKSLLIGESASILQIAAITEAIEKHPSVRKLIHVRTLHLGPEQLLVAGKIELDEALTFGEVVRTINEIEVNLRSSVPTAEVIYLEPDQYRPELASVRPGTTRR